MRERVETETETKTAEKISHLEERGDDDERRMEQEEALWWSRGEERRRFQWYGKRSRKIRRDLQR